MVSAQNRYVIYNKNPDKKDDIVRFGGVGVGVKPIIRAGKHYYYVKTRHKKQYFPIKDYGLQVIPAGRVKPTNPKVFNIKRKSVKNMPKGKGKGPGRPRKRGRPKGTTKKQKEVQKKYFPKISSKSIVVAKAKKMEKTSISQMQKSYAEKTKRRKDKVPTRVINMHGSNYTLYDEKPRTKAEAQKIRLKLKSQGKAAFLNPRKRKSGTQYFVYQKLSEHYKKQMKKPIQKSISKRTGIPTSSILMHGRKYNIHDNKPRTKSVAQALRKKLVGQGKAAFLNPRKRKSGTEYFVYEKAAERRIKSTSPKKSTPRKKTSKSRTAVIKELEAELKRLKSN